jgi:hypothetical protein
LKREFVDYEWTRGEEQGRKGDIWKISAVREEPNWGPLVLEKISNRTLISDEKK